MPSGTPEGRFAAVTVQCNYEITGPQVGRNVVAWRKRCKRRFRTPMIDNSPRERRCWQHRSG